MLALEAGAKLATVFPRSDRIRLDARRAALRRATLRWAALATLVACRPAAAHAPDATGSLHQFDLSAGGHAPFDGDLRESYGIGKVVTIGYAPRVGAGDTRLILDVGVIRSTGAAVQSDPTFEVDDAVFRLYPISLGIRTNVVPAASRGPVAFYFGAAVQITPTRWSVPFAASKSSPTVGMLLEIRPEVALTDRWSVWMRDRILLLADAAYGDLGNANHSGSQLELGVSFRPR